MAALLPLIRVQMLMGLFSGRGGFSINKIMKYVMMMSVLPMLGTALQGVGSAL